MSGISPNLQAYNNTYQSPNFLLTKVLRSGAFRLLGEARPRAMPLATPQVMIRTLTNRGEAMVGENVTRNLPIGTLPVLGAFYIPTYSIASTVMYNSIDSLRSKENSYDLRSMLDDGMKQTFRLTERNLLIYGAKNAPNEGILNAVGAYAHTLDPDQFGVSNISNMDQGYLATALSGLASDIVQKAMAVGEPTRLVILAPQRIITVLTSRKVVQLTDYQRPGAGVAGAGEMAAALLANISVNFELAVDDSLIGKGKNGTDLIIIGVPEIPPDSGEINSTNAVYAGFPNKENGCIVQYTDSYMPIAKSAITFPGELQVVYSKNTTSGIVVRPELFSLISVAY